MEALRKRAATLLSTGRLQTEINSNESSSNDDPIQEKQDTKNEEGSQPGNDSASSDSQSTFTDRLEGLGTSSSHRPTQIRPPWVRNTYEDNEDEDEDDPSAASKLLPQEPSPAQTAQHNHTPTVLNPPGFLAWNKPEPGRKYDGRRRSEPPTPKHHPREIASRWREFAMETEYPHGEDEHRQLVDEEYLVNHGPDFYSNWNDTDHDVRRHTYHPKRRTAWVRAQRTVLRSAFIPLIFRLLVFIFCVMSLGLGASIYSTARAVLSSDAPIRSSCFMDYETSTTSPLMAVVVDAAAIVYLFSITWDEYKGLPLGLRSGKAKISILLFDLFFIVFSSANVTLAFESIRNFDECAEQDNLQQMKWKQNYLASTLLVALIAWLMTFAVSVLRVVEKFEH